MHESRSWLRISLKVTAVLGLVIFAVWANLRAAEIESVRATASNLGYPGLFAASVISGFNLIVPVPVVAFFPFLLESGFQPVPTLATIALGMTGGDLLGYMIGNASREIVGERLANFQARVEGLHSRHPILPLALMFVYAAMVPIPNELLVIPLAFMRYSIIGIMTAVFLGNIVFNTLAAYGVAQFFPIG